MKKLIFILFVFFTVSKILTLFEEQIYDRSLIATPIEEEYDESLSHLNSIDNIHLFLGKEVYDSSDYVFSLDSLLRHRFYHRCSYYTPGTNLPAYLAGTFLWEHFKAVVIPDEILKFPCAQCSQIAIVFQSVLLQKGFKVRIVKLRNHYCTEVFHDGAWHFYDPDFEPIISKSTAIPSVQELMANPEMLNQLYNLSKGHKVHLHGVHYHFDPEYLDIEEPNKIAASNMRLLHAVSLFLVHYGWLVFGGIWLIWKMKSRKKH